MHGRNLVICAIGKKSPQQARHAKPIGLLPHGLKRKYGKSPFLSVFETCRHSQIVLAWGMISRAILLVTTFLAVFGSALSPLAAMTLEQALKVAVEHQEVKNKDFRLYSAAAEIKGDESFYSFTFFDGEKALHSVNVDATKNTRYQVREIAKISLFEEVDFSELPPCHVHCAAEAVDSMIEQAKAALEALGMKVGDRDIIRLNYHVRRSKAEGGMVHHCWSVTLPSETKNEGIRVGFIDGKLKSINPAKLR